MLVNTTTSRWLSALILISLGLTLPATAADYTVTNQVEFDAAVGAATPTGDSKIVNVNALGVSAGTFMSLPGDTSALTINFNGVSGGPTVYNPTFEVGFGAVNQTLGIGAGTTLTFNTVNGIASMRVGFADAGVAGTGTVNMTGGTINGVPAGGNYLSLNVGRGSADSEGTFNQSGGSVLINGGAFNVGAAGATGAYNMSGNALVNMGTGTVYIGTGTGGDGTLHIGGDAQFIIGGTSGQFYVGENNGHGTVIQDGAGSLVNSTALNGINLGTAVGSPAGNGGVGEYLLSAGELRIGGSGSNAGLKLGVDAAGEGTFTQTGGLVSLNSGRITFGPGTGTYNLNGGTLAVNVVNPFLDLGGANSTFNLGGGTIAGLTSFSTTMGFNLIDGTTSTFDTSAGTSSTLSGVLEGTGALKKAGDGTVILNAANTYSGGTWVSDGTLELGANGSLASTGMLQVDAGATFDLNDHDQEVASLFGAGTVLVGTGAFTAGGDNASTAFSGTVTMTNQGYQSPYGTFTKVGTGTLTIDGATFELGETYIQQGKMAQTSGITSVSYLAVGDGQNAGTPNVGGLDVSGGTITFGTGLQVGSWGGQGTVNQTGGTVQVIPECGNPANCSAMHIGNQGGTGTYNISGGELNLTGRLNTIGRSTGTNPGSTGALNISGTAVVDVAPFGGDPSRLIIGFGNANAAQAQSQGTVTQTGGTLRIHNGATLNIGGQNTSTGVYNLYGGTLEVGGAGLVAGYQNANPNYEFNLGGGTVKVIEAALTTSVDATLSSVSTIDTNGFGATWSGALSGDGALVKAGDGALIFNAANTYTGGTQIAAGTLRLGTGGSLAATGALQIDALGTFDLNDHTQTVGEFAGAGDVLLGLGALTAGGALNTEFSGSFSGNGTFEKQGSGTLYLTGDSSSFTGDTIVNGGRLVVNGSLASEVTVESGTLGGSGTIGGLIVSGDGTMAPGNSIGTINVAGNVIFQPQSIYELEVGPTGQTDLISATGTATMNGGTVAITQVGPVSVGTTYTILTAAGGRNGMFEGVTGDFAFLTATLGYDATDVFLNFARNGINFIDIADTPNQRAVAGALDQFPSTDPLFATILGGGEAGARQAFDALSGEMHASVSGVLATDSHYVRDAIFGRLIQASYTGAGGEQAVAFGAAGPTTVATLNTGGRMSLGAGIGDSIDADSVPGSGHGLTFWTSGFGSWGELDGNGNAATAQRNLGGFVSGVDAGIGRGWRAGLATGYIQSNISVGARSSSADINSYVLAGYAGGTAGPFAIRSGGAWTWHGIDSSRNVIFPGFFEAESASYNADTGQLFAEIAYPLLNRNGAIEPFAGLAYVHVGTDGFGESGPTAALTSAGSDQNIGYSLLGVRAATTLPMAGVLVTPHGSVAWQYAFGDLTPEQALAFASTGIAFGISGVPIAQSSALIEAGLDFALGPDAVFGISYAGQLASDLQDNGVQGRLDVRF